MEGVSATETPSIFMSGRGLQSAEPVVEAGKVFDRKGWYASGWAEATDEEDPERLVRGAGYVAYGVIHGRGDEVPPREIAGTVKDCGDFSRGEVSALDHCGDSLKDVGGAE